MRRGQRYFWWGMFWLNIGLASLWVGELYWHQAAVSPVLPVIAAQGLRTPDSSPGLAALPQMPPLEYYQPISLRPLFHNTRQPELVAAPAPAPVAVDLKSLLRLQGIFVQNTQRVALFEWLATHQVRLLREGESLEGWRLERLSADGAELSQGENRIQFNVRNPANASAAKPVQPPLGGAAALRPDKRR